jgi:general secretion pathway protein D
MLMLTFAGCQTTPPDDGAQSEAGEQRVFVLEHVDREDCTATFLSRLEIGDTSPVHDVPDNAVLVSGSPEQLSRASLVLELVDTKEDFVIEDLGPASMVRTLPSNLQIAAELGDIRIGTFVHPPQTDREARGIIDIQKGAVLAILPARHREPLLELLARAASEKVPADPVVAASEHYEPDHPADARQTLADPGGERPYANSGPQEGTSVTSAPADSNDSGSGGVPGSLRIALAPVRDTADDASTTSGPSTELQNGEDILDLDLPEALTLIQLFDLAGEYLDLDYVYDPVAIGNQTVSLKLHGGLQGEMRIRDLYTLLETVLKFKGLAMTRRTDKLVTIVPVNQVLDTDPRLIDAEGKAVQAGDLVVTRVFKPRYVDVASITNLLDSMKLGVAVSPSQESQILFVTCYAHRLSRIEQLVDMLDRPGRSRECLFRRLQFTAASALADKVRTLAEELQGIPVAMASGGGQLTPQKGKISGDSEPVGSRLGQPVYLDTDERTNRILIIGYKEQIALLEKLIDALDVAQEDLRTLQEYRIQYVDAEEVRTKLGELDVIGASRATSPRVTGDGATRSATASGPAVGTIGTSETLARRPQVVVIESTNSLLVNATAEQHAVIATIISYVDSRMPEEERPYRIYPLENSSPGHVADLLEQLIGQTGRDKEDKIEKVTRRQDQIVIVPDPNTFSLIVYTSRDNQEWIQSLIESLDQRRPQVLIDVALVEITRTDTFEYDLNVVGSAKELVIDNVGIAPIQTIDSTARVEGSFNLLDQTGNPTGQTQAFYSDDKVQALLTAISRKNYGRVLAKPKILVDDGQQGKISTTDETTYIKESVQVPNQGAPITTRDFEAIEATIQLEITPHISEGDLLRLDVYLSREDFGTRPLDGAPPDKTTSEITTAVFVPDNHTVILGGLVKLNQSKGGSKVPVLGDVPVVGALFRSIDNSDVERKLYVFLKANIVRPYRETRLADLERISEDHREAFEEAEAKFQNHENIPGIKPRPVEPERVLEDL